MERQTIETREKLVGLRDLFEARPRTTMAIAKVDEQEGELIVDGNSDTDGEVRDPVRLRMRLSTFG